MPETFGQLAYQGPHEGHWLRSLRRDPRQAIDETRIICLICGAPFRQLTNTHLRLHELTPLAYKRQFGYNLRRALMCLALRRVYSETAIRRGLAAAIRHRPIVSDPNLRRRGGVGPTALEERLTRREARRTHKAGASGKWR